jgi:glycosyltransferase involved in cell wall biosynthesis
VIPMSSHRILFLSPSMQGKGGVVEFCRMLVDNLGPDFQVDRLTIANRPGVRNPLRRAGHFIGDYFRLRKKLKESPRYSLCHLNPSFRILALLRDGLYLRLIHRFYPGRILVTFHGWDGRLLEKIRRIPLLRALLQNTLGKARMILVLSEKFKSQLEETGYPAGKIKVVTTMYEEHFADREDRTDQGPGERTGLVFVSRFIRCKGAHIAAETVKLLVEGGYANVHATLAGDGPEWEKVRNYVRENGLEEHIGMPGFVRGEEKRKTFEEGDIFFFPTYCQEGCPIVLLEAMGAGMAVVSTTMGAIPDIVREGNNGFLVEGEGRNPQEYADRIRGLLDDRRLMQKFQLQNQEEARSKYRARMVAQKIQAFYSEVLAAAEADAEEPGSEIE